MKKKLLMVGAIVASLSLTACGDSNTGNNDNIDVNEDVQNDADTDDTEIEDKDREDNGGLKEDLEDAGEDIKDKFEEVTMTDEQMIQKSEYIVKVKKIEKEKNNFEIKVLENLKGDLSATDIPNADTLEKNRAYLAFLKVEDGSIVPTNGKKSYILLEGDNHEIFEKINRNK